MVIAAVVEVPDRMVVDIKELKLLGDFDHPNIVRFVSVLDTVVNTTFTRCFISLVSASLSTHETLLS